MEERTLQSKNGEALVRELYNHGVSYANIAEFMNGCGYRNDPRGNLTEDMIRNFCRRSGLRREPGWNLKLQRKGGGSEAWAFLGKLVAATVLVVALSYVWVLLVTQ